MRNLLVSGLFVLAACGGSSDNGITNPPPPKKPDPYITVRVRNLMDTTTAPGRAHWHIYAMLSGPDTARNGVVSQGAIGLNDLELSHNLHCVSVGADSVGQRLLSLAAFADTTTSELTPDATADAIAHAWYGGDHNLPAGWASLSFPPTDAWQSAQYLAGHGLVRDDPIKWEFDWTGAGASSFAERTDSDAQCDRA
jgi:hypothetical protein